MSGPPDYVAGRSAGRAERISWSALGAILMVLATLAVAGCTNATSISLTGSHHRGRAPSTTTTAAPTPTTSTVPTITVTDAEGRRFVVRATVLPSPLALVIQGWIRSASPGHDFLNEAISVTNPTGVAESLQAFDDPTTGLGGGLQFVMDAVDASQFAYEADCGVDPAYPAQLCPISFPQGVVVDSDSAYTGGAAVTLAPGASAQIVYSFGPVLSLLNRSEISLFFSPGSSEPVDLSG